MGYQTSVKVLHDGRILAGYYGFNANISFNFQGVKIFGDVFVYLEIKSFPKGLVKFTEIGNFEDLVLF